MHYEQFQNGTVKCIEDEIPFEVPEGWAWARLASLIELFITGPFGSALHKSDYVVDGIPLINPKNIIDGKIIPITKMQVSPETVERLSSFKVAPNDIVIARRGNMGRCAVVQPDQEGWLCGTGSFVLRLPAVLCSDYFAACLRSPYSVELMSGNSIGNTMLNLNQTILKRILIPVPPCTEQNRIINAIFDADTLLAEIADQSESLVMCVAKTKFKILDLAIRGKLVPQDPNDEPASVLLEHIRAEKEKLIKQGKIKRDKKGSVIFKGEDNSYYEKHGENLPAGWIVTNFESLLEYEQPTKYIVRGTNYKPSYKTPVLTAGKSFILGYTNESDNIFNDLPVIIFDDFTTESKFVDFPFKVKSSAMKILHINTDLILPKYAFYLMQATKIDHENHQRYWISSYSQKEVALPPLKEQERILSKLEQYFSLLEQIQ